MERYHNTSNTKAAQDANLKAALALTKAGVPIIPAEIVVRSGKDPVKKPCIKGWQAKATTDSVQVKRWWKQFAHALPGIVTGPDSGIAVLDVDKKNGKDGFKALSKLGEMDSPISIVTPSGGRHIYFQHREGLKSDTDVFGLGLDVRATGGFVLAPGAVTAKGAYDVPEGSLKRLFADLPEWPATLIPPQRKASNAKGAKTGLPLAEFRDALLSIPNDGTDEDSTSYFWWIKMLAAIHCETDGSEEGLELAHEWSDLHPDYDPTLVDGKWLSFHRDDATGATILWEARKRGWINRAETDRLIDECWTPEELARIAEEALDEKTQADIDEMVGPLRKKETFFVDMADLLSSPAPSREWLVPDWISAKTVHMMSGDGGIGKTLLAMQLAVCTGTGTEWLGHEITKPGVALYYGAEDDRDEMHRRLEDVCRGLDVDPAEHRGRVHIRAAVAEDTVFATVAKDGRVKPTPILERIENEIASLKPTLVVLDTLANLHALDPNSQEQAKAFISLLIGIGHQHDCTFVLLAHPSRSGMASGDGDGFSVGWNNAVRSRSYLEADANSPGINILTSKKANYGQRGLVIKMAWTDGFYAKVNDEYVDASKAKHVFLEILDRLTKEGTFFSRSRGVNYAPNCFAQEPEATEFGFTKEQFVTAMNTMLKDGVLTVEEYQKKDRKWGKRIARGDVALEASELDHLLEDDE